ncbi:hypothetical protein BJY04DRAFT_188714 [Aspergillus karnatakaensis]|uniref:uncharacterized protein n=1 Tax=Aspergillus karnatakaensis TaxID=1810916 RepID=UPI003CCD52CB
MGFPTFCYNQLIVQPQLPTTTFTNQTIIVTGSNTGLGLATARHITKLGAEKVILAVRNTSAGEAARQSIDSTTGRTGVCEVWPLDLSSFDSVLSFADKALTLPRLDVLINNAAVATKIFSIADSGYEHSITVNNISHLLLALILLPKLRQTGKDFPDRAHPPYISVLTSQVHAWPSFPQRNDPLGILKALSDPHTANMDERYPVTKLLSILLTQELVSRLAELESNPSVIITLVEPGFCHSDLSRENQGIEAFVFDIMKTVFARKTEVGARTIVTGVSVGKEAHGKYLVNGVVADEALGGLAVSEEGKEVQRRLWEEVSDVIERVKPGLLKELGL